MIKFRQLSFIILLSTFSLTSFASLIGINVNSTTIYDINQYIVRVGVQFDGYTNYLNTSTRSNFIAYQDKFYYVRTNHALGTELWRFDPQTNNEQLIADINPGAQSADIESLTLINDTLYFSAYHYQYGRELWQYNITNNTASLIADIKEGHFNSGNPKSSNPQNLAVHEQALFFITNDMENDTRSLRRYTSENSSLSTIEVLDSDIESWKISSFQETLYIYAYENDYDREPSYILYYSNGDNELIRQNDLSDVEQLFAKPHTRVGNLIYGSLDEQLTVYDTESDIVTRFEHPELDIEVYDDIVHLDNKLYFPAYVIKKNATYEDEYNQPHGVELYQYDLATSEIILVAEIEIGWSYWSGYALSSGITNIFSYNDSVFFTALGQGDRKLWSYSPITGEVNQETIDEEVNTLSAYPYDLTYYEGFVYFIAQGNTTNTQGKPFYEIWRVNIATEELELFLELDHAYYSQSANPPPKLFILDNKLGYYVVTPDYNYQLWHYEATSNTHTKFVEFTNSSESGIQNITEFNNGIYFEYRDNSVNTPIFYIYNNQTESIRSIDAYFHSPLVFVSDNKALYHSIDQSSGNYNYWYYDFNTDTAHQIDTDNSNGRWQYKFKHNNVLYFNVLKSNDWITFDLSTNSIIENTINSPIKTRYDYSNNYIEHKGYIYFDFGGEFGNELYRFNVATNQVEFTRDLFQYDPEHPYAYFSYLSGARPNNFFKLRDELYFLANTNDKGLAKTTTRLFKLSKENNYIEPIEHESINNKYAINDTLLVNDKLFSIANIISENKKLGEELVVFDINTPPTIVLDVPASTRFNEQITLDATDSYDTESDSLQFSWSQLTGTSVSINTANEATASFETPKLAQSETLTFELAVFDGLETTKEEFSIDIERFNEAPIVQIAYPTHYDSLSTITITSTAEDFNNDSLSYLWEQTSGIALAIANNTNEQLIITLPKVTQNEDVGILLSVSDGELTTQQSITFTITPLAKTSSDSKSGGAISWLSWLLIFIFRYSQNTNI